MSRKLHVMRRNLVKAMNYDDLTRKYQRGRQEAFAAITTKMKPKRANRYAKALGVNEI